MAKGKQSVRAGQELLRTTGLQNSVVPTGEIPIDASGADRQRRIAEAAYRRAERRGFAPGNDVQDWLEAEKEIDGQSNANRTA
jgi:hypothetical protein